MDYTSLIIPIAVVAAVVMLLWMRRKPSKSPDTLMQEERIDTLIGWPPEPTRILRSSERLAYSTLKLALPGYMILAQVPVARFINVTKRNSYGEWMRRLGSQCVDFVVCDVTSQVIAVIEIRPPDSALNDRLRRRVNRLARTLDRVGIPIHVWNEEALPSVEVARSSILPDEPAVPNRALRRPGAPAAMRHPANGFENTEPLPTSMHGGGMEVIEMPEPSSTTWFDELDSESSKLPPRHERGTH